MDEINILDYLAVIGKRKRVIFFILIFCVLSSGFFSFFVLPRTYESKASLILPPSLQPSEVSALVSRLSLGAPSLSGISQFLGGTGNICIAILKSRWVMEKVINNLRLKEKYKVNSMEKALTRLRNSTSIALTKEGIIEIKARFNGSPQATSLWASSRNNSDDEARRVSAAIANEYVKALREYTQKSTLWIARQNRIFIEGQLKRAKVNLAKAEEALKNFEIENKAVALPEQTKLEAGNLAKLEAQRITLGMSLERTRKKIRGAERELALLSKTEISERTFISNPVAEGLRQQLVYAEVELANARQNYTDDHPNVLLLKDKIANIKEALRKELSEIFKSRTEAVSPVYEAIKEQWVSSKIDQISLEAQKQLMDKILKEKEEKLDTLPPKELEFSRLTREVKVQEALYKMLAQEYERAKIAEAREAIDFQILDRAVAPERKISPKIKLNMGIAGVLGLFVGVFFAFLMEYWEGERKRAKPEVTK